MNTGTKIHKILYTNVTGEESSCLTRSLHDTTRELIKMGCKNIRRG